MSVFDLYSSQLPSVRRRRLLGLAGSVLALGALSAHAVSREPLPVVVTFSILGDMVKEIGGDRVAVTTLVGANGDVHGHAPTPQDAKALQNARVLVLNGLDFESWLPRLLRASGFEGRQVLASKGVTVRSLGANRQGHAPGHEHGPGIVDPHAWQDLANGMIYARNIAAGLSKADPRNTAYYESRAAGYVARMRALDNEIRSALGGIEPERRRVITSHDAFGYFGAAYRVEFIPVAGLSSQSEASAGDVARLVNLARESRVGGVFIENMSSPVLAQQIARESGVLMGGTLYADALAPPDQPAATYLGMISWNAGRLVYVLKKAQP